MYEVRVSKARLEENAKGGHQAPFCIRDNGQGFLIWVWEVWMEKSVLCTKEASAWIEIIGPFRYRGEDGIWHERQ